MTCRTESVPQDVPEGPAGVQPPPWRYPAGSCMSKDRRPLESKRYASASGRHPYHRLPGTAEEYAATVKLLAGFTKNTGITITPVSYNNNGGWVETFQILSTRIAGGLPLDSAYIATEGMLLFEEQGLLDPLDSFIAADKTTMNAFYNDVPPHMLDGFPGPRRHPRPHLLRAHRLQRHVDLVQPGHVQGVQRARAGARAGRGTTSSPRPPRRPTPRTGWASPSAAPCPAPSPTCTRGCSPTGATS